jgi:hypothetical protein
VIVLVVAAGAIGGLLYYFRNNPQNPTSNGSTSQASTGEPPIWHTFDNVYNGNSNCQIGATVVTCIYDGTSYYGIDSGIYPQDCNVSPNGAIPIVNGTSVPYRGCVLSRAPVDELFSDLYTLSGSGASISMWSISNTLVTVFPTANFQQHSCSYGSFSTLTCSYLGMVYAGNPANVCNLGTPIQLNGEPIPTGSCMLQRTN